MVGNSNVELCSKLLMVWLMESRTRGNIEDKPRFDGTSEYGKSSFIAKVLRKKLEVFNVPVKVPDELLMIIEICTGGNPGTSQLMLKEILGKDRKAGEEITSMDFARTYPTQFPIVNEFPKWEKHFNDEWSNQKDEDGNNLCDTPEWWLECFV